MLQEVNELPHINRFNTKNKGLFQAVQGIVIAPEKTYYLLVWDIKKRDKEPLKNLITQDHPAVILKSKTTDFHIHYQLVQTLNRL